VDALAAAALDDLGGIDILVNNAGIPKRRHVTRLDAGTVDAVMRINYAAPVHLTLALLPQMLERGEGRVVNVSSVAAHLSSPGEAAYSASKAALAAFSETLALDLWDTGVRSMVVYPGVVDTELFTLPDNDPSLAAIEALTVDEAVAQIMAALAEDAVEVYVPGWFADVVTGKANDLGAFLAGAAAWVRQQQPGSGTS
jgi:NAD(P)-dependent dehydrogenase (short-subunit alcohol dehydrogenase family)